MRVESCIHSLKMPAPLTELSKTVTWRAEYLSAKFAPYEVIYHAIARPKIFSIDLLQVSS